MDEAEEPLTGGNTTAGVVRVGDTVRRPPGPWTADVHALLDHLALRAYPAPRALGFDERGREILTFVPGVAVWPDHYDAVRDRDGLRRAGALIAAYHEAQSDFVPRAEAQWRADARDPSGSDEILAHNDFGPWNLIVGPEWAFIDWDMVAPGRRAWDLAWALHTFAGLWPNFGFTDADVAERIIVFCDAALVDARHRRALLETVVERTMHNATETRRRAEQGEDPYVRLAAEGHPEAWEAGSNHVAENLDRWLSLMA